MIREFCDNCGKETERNYIRTGLSFSRKFEKGSTFIIGVSVCRNRIRDSDSICFDCLKKFLLEALDGGEDFLGRLY